MRRRSFIICTIIELASLAYYAYICWGREVGIMLGLTAASRTERRRLTALAHLPWWEGIGSWLGLAGNRLHSDPYPALVLTGSSVLGIAVVIFFRIARLAQEASRDEAASRTVTYRVTIPLDEEIGILPMRVLWLGVHKAFLRPVLDRAFGQAPHLVWCDVATTGTAYYSTTFIRVVGSSQEHEGFKHSLHLFPQIQVEEAEYPRPASGTTYTARLQLAKPSSKSILTEFEEGVDVRSALNRYLRTEPGVEQIEIIYRMRPTGAGWARAAYRKEVSSLGKAEPGEWRAQMDAKNYARRKQVPFAVTPSSLNKISESDDFGWDVEIEIAVTGSESVATSRLETIAKHYFSLFAGENRFIMGKASQREAGLGFPVRWYDQQILSPAELAAVCHFVNAGLAVGVEAATSRFMEAERSLVCGELKANEEWQPVRLSPPTKRADWPKETEPRTELATELEQFYHQQPTVLGLQRGKLIGVLHAERPKSTMVIGPPGVGKSELLATMARGDIESSEEASVIVIEPHDLCRKVMRQLSRPNWGRLIYFNPKSLYNHWRATTLNMMEMEDSSQLPAVQAEMMETFRAISGDHWETSGRMQKLLEKSLALVLEVMFREKGQASLVDLFMFMTSQAFRTWIYERSRNPSAVRYWQDYFDRVKEEEQQKMISPVLRRVDKMVDNAWAANVVGSRRSTLSMHNIIEGGRIFLVNLPGAAGKGGGDQTMQLLWMFLVSRIRSQGAKRLETQPIEEERKLIYLTMDEAQLGINGDVNEMVAQYRKLRFCPTFAFQSLEQIDKEVIATFKDIISNKIIFRGEGSAADTLAVELLNGGVEARDVSQLLNFNAYAKLLSGGNPARTCTIQTLPPPKRSRWETSGVAEQVGIDLARTRYPARSAEAERLLGLIEVAESKTRAARKFAQLEPEQVEERKRLMQTATGLQDAAVEALQGSSEEAWNEVWDVQRKRDLFLANWLLANPGVTDSQFELLERWSEQMYSVPAGLVVAERLREDAAFAAAFGRQGNNRQGNPRPRSDNNGQQPLPSSQPNLPIPPGPPPPGPPSGPASPRNNGQGTPANRPPAGRQPAAPPRRAYANPPSLLTGRNPTGRSNRLSTTTRRANPANQEKETP